MKDIFIVEGKDTLFYAPLKRYCEAVTCDEDYEYHMNKCKKLPSKTLVQENEVPELYLTLTNSCNLSCKYCYAETDSKNQSGDTTKRRLTKSIKDYFLRLDPQEKRDCTIGFSGGCEPTCRFDLLKYAVEIAEDEAFRRDMKVHFVMTTNGQYSDEVAEFINQHFSKVSLSFDGPKHIQNTQRPSKVGKDSFDLVFKNARFLYGSRVEWLLNAVVTEYSVDYMDEIACFFTHHFANTPIDFALMDMVNDNVSIKPPKRSDFEQHCMELEQQYPHVVKKVKKHFTQLKDVECNAISSKNWYVSDAGIISSCIRAALEEDSIFTIGHYNDDESVTLNEEAMDKLGEFSIHKDETCQSCFAKYLCGGGCPYLREHGQWNCDQVRKDAKEHIISTYESKIIAKELSAVFGHFGSEESHG